MEFLDSYYLTDIAYKKIKKHINQAKKKRITITLELTGKEYLVPVLNKEDKTIGEWLVKEYSYKEILPETLDEKEKAFLYFVHKFLNLVNAQDKLYCNQLLLLTKDQLIDEVNTKLIKNIFLQYIKRFGYEKGPSGTIKIALDRYRNNTFTLDENKLSELDIMILWAHNKFNELKDNPNDYYYNAITAFLKPYLQVKDLSLVASLVGSYYKELNTTSQEHTSNYVGNIGERITIQIKSIRVLYTSKTEYSYNYYSTNYVYEILDKDNNVYIYKTTKDLHEVKLINALVKKHNDYKGTKQTIITRANILD